jgi:hypothetical protein
MFDTFHQYCESRRPMLDEALDVRISALLRHVPTISGRDLRRALIGGKKLRGILLGLIAEVLGGDWDSALPRAVAVELIQAATLIHDDFVDQDRIRRHMPAVWTLEGARRAVLLGDVVFASAIHMMGEIGGEDGRVVSGAIAEISRGALMEPDDPTRLMEEMESGRLNRDCYEKIIHLKTAVLFAAACELGAISAEADEGVRKRCGRYGSHIGEAYQIADDVKEIRKHLANGCIHAHEMALLTPAVLCFAEEARPHVASILAGASLAVPQPLRRLLRCAEDRMQQEISHRLARAADELREVLEERRHGELGLKAPGDLLEMFNLS